MQIPAAYQRIIEKLEEQLQAHAAIEEQLNDPATAGNKALMSELSRRHGRLTRSLVLYRQYRQTREKLEEAELLLGQTGGEAEFGQMVQEEIRILSEKAAGELEAIVDDFLSADAISSDSIIMEIRAGTGGDEASLFARDLAEMYRRYCESKHWKFEVLDFSASDLGGFREIVINIKGTGVYQALALEGGGHRVQRVPATETQGRIHTSAATVAVLPEADQSDIEINPEEVREDVSRAGGPGGQNVNKVESAVQLTHLPTGITVRMREERSQHKNRDKAWRLLRTRVFEHFDSKRRAERASARRQMIGSGDRNERIRTYSFPQNRLTDHRLNRNFALEPILAGHMDDLTQALMQYNRQQRLESLDIAEKISE